MITASTRAQRPPLGPPRSARPASTSTSARRHPPAHHSSTSAHSDAGAVRIHRARSGVYESLTSSLNSLTALASRRLARRALDPHTHESRHRRRRRRYHSQHTRHHSRRSPRARPPRACAVRSRRMRRGQSRAPSLYLTRFHARDLAPALERSSLTDPKLRQSSPAPRYAMHSRARARMHVCS